MKKGEDFITYRFLILILILVILSIIFLRPFSDLFYDFSGFKKYVLSFGILSPVVFILLMIFQVLVPPIPGQLAGFVSGFLFGWKLGTLYSMIGLVIGSYLVFYLSRRYGRPFIEKAINRKKLQKYDKYILRKGPYGLFLIFLLPFLPDDGICYIAGLTKIKMRTLVLVSLFGRFPGFLIFNLLGGGVSLSFKYAVILFGIVLLIFILFYFKEKLQNIMFRLINRKKELNT